MLGFLIGAACLIGLIKVTRRSFGHGGCVGYGGPWSREHWGHGGRRRGGLGPRMFLRRALERLDTTPGQEKVVVEAIDRLKETFVQARQELRATRSDLAQSIRGEVLDEASLADLFMKHDTTISATRRAAVEQLHAIHDALTDKQRATVADFVEHGSPLRDPRWGRDPYRGRWA